ARRLADFPEMLLLGRCIGDFDITAWALFSSNAHLDDFLTNRLNRVPGILRTSTSTVVRILKREWASPVIRLHGEGHSKHGSGPETSEDQPTADEAFGTERCRGRSLRAEIEGGIMQTGRGLVYVAVASFL